MLKVGVFYKTSNKYAATANNIFPVSGYLVYHPLYLRKLLLHPVCFCSDAMPGQLLALVI